MGQHTFYIIQIISTFSVVPVLSLGVLVFRKNTFPVNLFVGFCAFGFITDLLGWYFYLTNNVNANQVARHFYILIESSFYFWFVGAHIQNKIASRLFKKAWIMVIPIWVLTIFFWEIPQFKVFFQIIISFALSFCLIQFVEKDESARRKFLFWFFLGSFFYYFCTFFFMNFLYSQFGLNLWYVRNILGIVANLMFAWGFWVNRPSMPSRQSGSKAVFFP